MTTEELIIQLYENSLEDSRLFPYDAPNSTTFDISVSGSVKCLGYLNRAYKKIVSWKRKRGKMFLFPNFYKQLNFKTSVVTDTAQAGSSDTLQLAVGSSVTDDYYNDWVVKITDGTGEGQIRIVMDYVASTTTITVNRDFDTTPDATSVYVLYKNFFSLSEIGISDEEIFYSPLKIYDMKNRDDLIYGSSVKVYVDNLETYSSDPTEYMYYQNKLYFNFPVSEAKWYRMEYRELPGNLVNSSDEPEITEPFHEAILWYALWLVFNSKGEIDEAYSKWKYVEDLMENTILPTEGEFDRTDAGMMMLNDTNYSNSGRL